MRGKMLRKYTLVAAGCIACLGTGCPEKKKIVKPDKVAKVVRVSQPEEFYNLGIDALKAKDNTRALAAFRDAVSKMKENPGPGRRRLSAKSE